MSCSTGFSILSEPRVATVENASEAEGEAALCQGHVESVESVPQATQPDVNIHSYDINTLQLEEQRVTKHNAMHWLPQGDATPNQRKSSTMLGDTPLPKTPKPNFDPFERILKPFLEQDTVQCNAWKEEVQNILIFAGLFSAVVTAFIIESYQRLQPDPNDAIVGLLAHIAETLDNPSINGTASVSSLVPNDSNFSPSHSDININIFWFISLILSLTAALVGIITLQWLREHQRYDNTLKSQQQMAIFNARVHSLEEWYVPQIFAGLPLLLQGALVLFFAGMVEFLFSLRLEVAIPVTLSICVPLIFLIVTTLLPTLQVYILQYPFRLSINDKVPSPCPYKSPQSLIFRRIGVHSETVFRFFASIVTSAYVCLVKIGCFIRKVVGSPPPIFRSHPPHFQDMLRTVDPAQVLSARDAGWTSIDMSWLFHRKFYTLSLRLACEDSANESWTQDSMARSGRITMRFIVV
ncbi:hypothetical protein D9619_009810 [Psilocybe cf. subviscida]|uniref:DUF6535 domain-containing protein n=1 Tax=Psilocybe cf. subviscida TaxID=2480587 RepID=A0A8H5BMR5_9AGAR|nr:hypothetical protein D9619_009810 [Psilocybe cf. subviscida]